MDLDRLNEFVTIARAGSLKKAAVQLKLAPNVLSARLKSFESSLHTTLFIRNSHGIHLTNSGQLMLDNSADIISSYQALRLSMTELKDDFLRTLTIQISGCSMAPEIGIFLDSFNRRHSQIQLNLLGDSSYSIADGFSNNCVDLFVIYSLSPALNTPYESFSFYHTQRLSVYVPNDHPLASRRHVSFEDLSDECFILYPESSENCMRECQLACLNKSGISYRIYDGTCTSEFYRLLVPIGKGITISPLIDLAPPNSSVLQLTDPGYEIYAHLVYNPGSTNPAAANFIQEFKDFLKRDNK